MSEISLKKYQSLLHLYNALKQDGQDCFWFLDIIGFPSREFKGDTWILFIN